MVPFCREPFQSQQPGASVLARLGRRVRVCVAGWNAIHFREVPLAGGGVPVTQAHRAAEDHFDDTSALESSRRNSMWSTKSYTSGSLTTRPIATSVSCRAKETCDCHSTWSTPVFGVDHTCFFRLFFVTTRDHLDHSCYSGLFFRKVLDAARKYAHNRAGRPRKINLITFGKTAPLTKERRCFFDGASPNVRPCALTDCTRHTAACTNGLSTPVNTGDGLATSTPFCRLRSDLR